MFGRMCLLKGSLSSLAILCAGAAATAQDADSDAENFEELEEIVVTGIRSSLKKALEVKRNSSSIVDALSAEDIGVFPDENVAEALQRLPGIAISRNRGEGARVSIRGLGPDQNLTLLNGQFIASSNQFEDEQPSRSFNYALIASEVISSAEVYKTPEARLDEGGVGGTVILNTRRPLSLEDGYLLAGSVEGGYSDQAEELDPRFSLSTGWRSADKNFGVILSGAYTERTIRGDGTGPLSYSQRPVDINSDGILDYGTIAPGTPDPSQGFGLSVADSPMMTGNEILDSDGNVVAIEGIESAEGLFLPDLIANTYFPSVRERIGGSAAIEWQATPSLNFHLTGLYSRLNEEGVNNNFLTLPLRAQNVVEPVNNAVIVDNTVVSGTIPQRVTDGVNWTGTRGNVFTTALDSFDRDSRLSTYAIDLGTTYEPVGGNLSVFTNIGYTQAKVHSDNRFFETVGFGSQTYDLTVPENGAYSLSEDLLDPSQQFFSFINFITLDQIQDEFHGQVDFTYQWNGDFFDTFQFGAKYRQVTQDRNQSTASFGAVAENYADRNGVAIWGLTLADLNPQVTPDNFLESYDQAITTFMYPDAAAVDDFFGAGRAEDSVFDGAEVTTIAEFFDIKEEIWAGYGQANFNGEIGSINVRGNIGTRVTHLKRSSDANVITNGVPEPFTQVDTQTDVLPSMNLAFDMTENLVMRFSAARALARPTFRQLSPTIVVIEETLTANAGNPDLDNFVANSFDFSAEYYYGDGNAISVATFYKDILSFTVSRQQVEALDVNGETANVLVTRPRNGGGGEIYGLEFALVHNFQSLPEPFDGLGVNFNYTLSDSRVDDPDFAGLPGQSRHTVNASVFYDKGPISARIAYNYRSGSFRGVSNGQNRFLDGNSQVDFNASYRITEWASLFVEGLNITNNLAANNYFAVPVRIGGQGGFGRRFFFGARFNF